MRALLVFLALVLLAACPAASAQTLPTCEKISGPTLLSVNESGRYEVTCSHVSEFRDFIWAMDEDIVYHPKRGLDPSNLSDAYDSRPFKEASTHKLVMWAILPDNTRSNILEWRIEVVGPQYGDDSPPECRKLTPTPRVQVNKTTSLQLVCNDDRGWHSSEWRINGEVVDSNPRLDGLTTIDLADGYSLNLTTPGRHSVAYTIADSRDQVATVEWDIFAYDLTDQSPPTCAIVTAPRVTVGMAGTWIARCSDDRGLYDIQWIANGTLVARTRLRGEREYTPELTWTPAVAGELRMFAVDAGGRESIPATAIISPQQADSAPGEDPSLKWQIAGVIIAALTLLIAAIELFRRRRPPPPMVTRTGTVEINVNNSNVGTISVPPPPPPPPPADPRTLRRDARKLLYVNGRLAEAVAIAQAYAHELGRRDDERWLGWELRGLPTAHSSKEGEVFTKRAGYRQIKVGVPEWLPKRGGPRPPTYDFTIFWGRPIDELERTIERLKAEPSSAGVIHMSKDELFARHPKLRRMIAVDPVPLLLDVHALEGLREGLRATVGKFLDENDAPAPR